MNRIGASSLMKSNMQLPNFKQIEKNIQENVRGLVRSMVKTFEFNWIYSQGVSERQEKITAKAVKEYREKFWKQALKKAEGNEDKAYEIYMNLYPI